MAYVPPAPVGPRIRVQILRMGDPLRWLGRGAADLRAHPGIALFYGLAFWLMLVVLGAVFRYTPEYTMTMVSGCLLVGPFVAMGLYDVSRRREQHEPPTLARSLTCWAPHVRSVGLLLLVLLVLELLWGRASLVVFAVFFNTGLPSSAGVLSALLDVRNWEFLVVYLGVGGLFASLVFAISVVSIPMILDRDTDAISAAIASIRVVFENTAVMLGWGVLLSVLVLVSLLPWGLGLIVIGPWLGHASWHAYRASVAWDEDAQAVTVSHLD